MRKHSLPRLIGTNPRRPHPVWCRAIAFLLFARMVIEKALPIINNCKFDANTRRFTQLKSEFDDIKFRSIKASQRHFGNGIDTPRNPRAGYCAMRPLLLERSRSPKCCT